MTYIPYVNVDDFKSNTIPTDERISILTRASRHIDTLTFNRIVGKFDLLTDFQKELVQEVCADLANWEYDNSEMLENPLKSYSINGVSVEFGGTSVSQINGVFIPTELYQRLCQTGLCCRRV